MLYTLHNLLREFLEAHNLEWAFRILDQLTFRALAAALLAFFAVLFGGRPVIGWLRRKKIGDTGATDAEALRLAAHSKANTPTMGGLIIVGAILFSVLLLADVSNFYVQLGMIVLVWLAALGGFDDWLKLTAKARAAASGGAGGRQGLFAWEKLVFQLGLGLLVGYFTYRYGDTDAPADLAHVLNLPFQKTYDPPGAVAPYLVYLTRPVFIIWSILFVSGMSNAVNISDGMDGLAGGITVAAAFGLTVLAYIAGTSSVASFLLVPYVTHSEELAVFAAATTGACLGFLWWNCSPAQVFMGDTGALALGGILAYIALVIRQEILLLIMSGIFLIEIGSVMLQVGCFKITRGKRIFKVAPYHHHLHLSGWTEQQVVTRFWIISGILVVLALALIKVR
ncbi:MAG: phospho-N-acetylmuramoyl-pentapeptide-transferase [Phycisphaeraceae bacterium]|nr:phospho-N-acetylmuramoyl-pentapeptide-transferase [Phycisphaeraceae bacterium]